MIPTFVLSIPVEYEAFKKYDENTFGFLKNYLLTQKLTLLKPNLIFYVQNRPLKDLINPYPFLST